MRKTMREAKNRDNLKRDNWEVRGARLELCGIDRNFGARVVLRNLHLEVGAGEFVAIVGKSGSGKSTLLRLVAGLDAPTGGRLCLEDLPIRGINPITRMMFQDARLLPWKRVLDNVTLGLAREQRARAEWALSQVGLADRGGEWPAVLSGGQRQRVALARALAAEPRLLLLDEPLGALDALTRLDMQQLLETLWREQGFTTLLVTHDVEEAVALADRVIVLEEGEVVLDCVIDLPRPRLRSGRAFLQLKEIILARLLGSIQTSAVDFADF
jgi:sulfonate transport system ATP-binding protein